MSDRFSTNSGPNDDNGEVVLDAAEERSLAASVAVLEHLAATAGVDFDSSLAKQAARRAVREIPGPYAETWLRRLSQSGKELALRIARVRLSVREVGDILRPNAPIIAFAPRLEPTAGWLVLVERRGGKLRVEDLSDEGEDEWLRRGRIARMLGLPNIDTPADWAIAQPAMPMAEAVSAGANGHHAPSTHASGGSSMHGMPPLRRLWSILAPERRDIWVVVLFGVTSGVLSLATPLAVESLVTTVAFGRATQLLVVLSLILLFCLAFAGAIRAVQTYIVEILQRRLFVRLAADLAYRLPRVDLHSAGPSFGPELVNRFFDILTIQKSIAGLLLDGLTLVLQTIVGMAILAMYHPALLGFDIGLLLLLTFAIVNLGRGGVRTAIEESRSKYAVAGWLEAMARNPSAFKSSGGPALALDRSETLLRRFLHHRGQHFGVVFRQICFSLGLVAIASTALLGLGGWLVIQGQLTLGQLVAAELIVTVIVGSFAKMGKHFESYFDLLAGVDKVGHLLDLPLEPSRGDVALANGPARLAVSQLRSPASTGRDPFGELDLRMEPGQHLALLGPAASGKSLLGDILTGIHNPAHGRVELDGLDLRDVRLDSLRERVAVAREHDVVEETILENVRMGRESMTVTQVRQALSAVSLLEDVLSLPEGLHTHLTAAGFPLSLNQCRRLAIARAIAGNPGLLVLDGIVDPLPRDQRLALLDFLSRREAPWSLLVLTCDPTIAETVGRVARLDGSVHEPKSASLDLETRGHGP